MTIQEKTELYLSQNCKKDDKILMCVSGGIDSMVLLDILCNGGWNTEIAHCNFSLRGLESDGDEAFVLEASKKYGIKCHNIRFDTHQYAKEHGLNTQLAARELRYNYFYQLKEEFGYTKIAIAHHLDDSIETFFINLLRGTGIKGLSGISHKNASGLIRPMLASTRSEIIEYAANHHISYREDSSNSGDHYLRNKIRHHIIPNIQAISSGFKQRMLENFNRLSMASEFIDYHISSIKEDIFISESKIDLRKFRSIKCGEFVLFEILHPRGFNKDIISQLYYAICNEENGKWFMGDSLKIFLQKDIIYLAPLINDSCETYKQIHKDNQAIRIINTEEITINEIKNADKTIGYFDIDKISFPLSIRKWEAGDRFKPLGMPHGSKTVGDFLTDRKIPGIDRENILVISNGGNTDKNDIVWIIGYEIGDNYKIDKHTKHIVSIDSNKL